MKTVLVTGGAGFIGSNFIRYMIERYRDYRIINMDALTYAGNLNNLKDIKCNPNYIFIRGDIRDKANVEGIFNNYEIDYVVNLAAESHVDRSIVEPEIFITTNILGTQQLLDAAKKHWKTDSNDKCCISYRPGVKFLQVSTDEVYGALNEECKFSELMPLMPNNPYAASKAGADMLVRAYHKTFGMPVNITRCCNNYGPYQFPEKLIPLMIKKCLKDEALPVYGDGMQVRDWLHVNDHCFALDKVLHEGLDGEVYNVGGNNERTNIEIVKLIIEALGKPESLISYVKDRPGHDRRYAVDSSKIASKLGWKPIHIFEKGIRDTIEWYMNNREWLKI